MLCELCQRDILTRKTSMIDEDGNEVRNLQWADPREDHLSSWLPRKKWNSAQLQKNIDYFAQYNTQDIETFSSTPKGSCMFGCVGEGVEKILETILQSHSTKKLNLRKICLF